MLTLNIEKRDIKANLDDLREMDKMPAVFYGKGVESTSITVSYNAFKKIWREAGTSSLITLKGVGEDVEAVVQEMDIDPVTSQVRHLDFYIIERGKVMEVSVPLEFVGESLAVKNFGGILVKALHELKIEVLPKDLPQQIEVDISSLTELDSTISIKDLKLPAGVRALYDEEESVASITQAVEEVVEEGEPADIADIEIEKKGKQEEEAPTEDKKD